MLEKIIQIETENYLLRGVTLDDAEALFELMSDAETMTYITPHPVTSIEELKEKIKGYLENFQMHKEIPWVIVSKAFNKVVGLFRFHKLNLWHKKAEMGAILHKDFQRKGVMTEVLKVALDYGFLELELNRIVGDIFAENKGSEKLLHQFGFKKEGTLRQTDFDGKNYHDTVVFSMLKEEYKKSH